MKLREPVLLLLFLFIGPRASVFSQEVQAILAHTGTNHDLIKNPTGAAVSVGFSSHRRIGIHLTLGLQQASFDGFGSA